MADSTLEHKPFQVPDVRGIELKKLTRVPATGPDYIPTPSRRGRDIFQRLFFNTGASFLTGFVSGGLYGCVEGLRTAVNPSLRIRLNSVINSMSRRGSRLGNALGIIGFLHTTFIGIGDAADLDLRTGYNLTPTLAGVATGMLFASIRGRRAAMLAGAIGGVGSAAVWYGGAYVYNVYFTRGRF